MLQAGRHLDRDVAVAAALLLLLLLLQLLLQRLHVGRECGGGQAAGGLRLEGAGDLIGGWGGEPRRLLEIERRPALRPAVALAIRVATVDIVDAGELGRDGGEACARRAQGRGAGSSKQWSPS